MHLWTGVTPLQFGQKGISDKVTPGQEQQQAHLHLCGSEHSRKELSPTWESA